MNDARKVGRVTIPTDLDVVPETLEMQSAMRRNAAPNAADAGIRYLDSEPTKILAIWGPTNPTKPIVPVNDTTAAVIKDTTVMDVKVVRFVSIPML